MTKGVQIVTLMGSVLMLACTLLTETAHSGVREDLSVEQYMLLRETQNSVASQVAVNYASGLLDAYGTGNAMLESNHQRPIYCQPGSLSMSVASLEHLIESMVERRPQLKRSSMAVVALFALIDTFPCK